MNKVLLVEDEENLVDIVATVLEEEGLVVRTAVSAEEALTVIPAFSPDLIVSDLKMAEMDGFEMVERIRANPSTALVKVIFLTSHTDASSQAKAKEVGAVAYMTKPFDIDELVKLIRAALA